MRHGKRRIRDSNLLPLETPKKKAKADLTTATPNQKQREEKSQRAGLRRSIWGLGKFGKFDASENQMVRTIDLQSSAPQRETAPQRERERETGMRVEGAWTPRRLVAAAAIDLPPAVQASRARRRT